MKNKIYLLFAILFFIAFVNADIDINSNVQTLGNFKLNECVLLRQTATNTTSCNISSVFMPNSTIAYNNIQLTKSGIDFTSTICNISNMVGEWQVTGECNLDGVNTPFVYNYYVQRLTVSEAIIYFVALALCFLFFIMSLYFSIAIPFKNPREDDGRIITINKLKYLKIVLIAFTYMFLLFLFGITRSITANFLMLPGISNIFNWGYWILFSALYPIMVLTFVGIIVFIVEDKIIYKKSKRGGFYR